MCCNMGRGRRAFAGRPCEGEHMKALYAVHTDGVMQRPAEAALKGTKNRLSALLTIGPHGFRRL